MPDSDRSYVCGTADRPLIYKTIGKLFDDTVARFGRREAVVVRHQRLRWTYAELKDAVDRVAAGFTKLGLQPGDRVGIWSPNRVEWVVVQFATAKAGLILVNINPAYRLVELEYALNKVGCKALILADRFKTSSYIEMIRTLAPEIDVSPPGALRADKLKELKTVIHLGDETLSGFFKFSDISRLADEAGRGEIERLSGILQPDDPVNIQFTSGTTGFPKGATLSHFNILNNGFFVTERMGITEKDRICVPVPLYHCFGMVMAVLGGVAHGAAVIFPSEGFEAEDVLMTVAEERCTALYGVPSMFIAELNHPNFPRYDLGSLRTGIMAGAACPIEVMKRVMEDMHMSEVTICYGMTETSPVSLQSHTDDPVSKRVSTVGRVHPFVEVKIVDDEDRVVSRGKRGELLTRGYSVMRGYWNDPERTREAVDDAGWMHTGDLATMDEEGYLRIEGRLDDMIIRGGENIYPREVEEFLYRNPKVEDVQVFGVPDAAYGEQVCAWIRLREGATASEEEIRSFCRGQIAHFKIPRHIRFVTDFPMTVTGKVQKYVMRDKMKIELGRPDQDLS